MQDALIANWNNKKFTLFIVLLIIAQITCFVIGALVAPQPPTIENILATSCNNDSKPDKWYYKKGKGSCKVVDMFMYDNKIQYEVYQVIYAIQMSSSTSGDNSHYSRWQHNLIALLHIDLVYQDQLKIMPRFPIVLDARLAYRNKDDPDDAWKPYAVSRVETILECSICDEKNHHNYDCMPIPLFKLDSLYHDYYLLNIRFPFVESEKNINKVLGYMTDLWLTAIKPNGGFTKVHVNLQTIFFPIGMSVLAWYWRRVLVLPKFPTLLQYMISTLGAALSLLNVPIEYLTLYLDMPVILCLNNIKQGIFYTILLSFFLIFVGEHLMMQDYSSLKRYRFHLSSVLVGCLSLFICDIWERVKQFRNPFFFISIINIGTEFTSPFIIFAGILAGLYLLLLTYMIWKVFINISIKKAVLPSSSPSRRLHGKFVVYRFKFLMIATLLCASLTVLRFIFDQMAEIQLKWNEDYELETPSTFYIGVYGMWNIYTVALLCLYAPSQMTTIS